MLEELMRKFVEVIDPKLEKYRARKKSSETRDKKLAPKSTFEESTTQTAPQSLAEFIEMIKRTPKSVLSNADRKRIAAIMSFDAHRVRDLMVPKKQMVFVKDTEILGPLMLDRLYKSGFTNFPVVDYSDKVLGIIHTEALNTLEIKNTDRAAKYLDAIVYYLHEDDTLEFAVSEIERTNSYYFLVLDKKEALAGFFTVQMLLDYLLG